MRRLLLVCAGGALGTGARHLLATWFAHGHDVGFALGIVVVNVTGSFLIALVTELSLATGAIGPDARLFLTTGIMGGYTTYSSYNQESLRLLAHRAYPLAALNVGLTTFGALAAGFLGVIAARRIAGPRLRPPR